MYEKIAEQFWHNGYVHLQDFFERETLLPLDNAIRKHFGDSPEFYHNEEFLEKSSTDVIPWFPQRESICEFDVVEQHENFQRLTGAILGEGWRTLYCMCMFSKPFSKGQAWHQDCPPEDQKAYNLNRLVYTSDIEPRNGGQLVIIPGSHRMPRISCGPVDEDMSNQHVISPKTGDLVLLHGHCWHRVLPMKNSSRLSTNYRCLPVGAPDDVTDVGVYRNMVYRFSTSEILENREPKVSS